MLRRRLKWLPRVTPQQVHLRLSKNGKHSSVKLPSGGNWFSSYLKKKELLRKIFLSRHENKIGRYYQPSSPYFIFGPPWSSWKMLYTVNSCFSNEFNLSALRCIFPRNWLGSTFLLTKILELWAIKATKTIQSPFRQNGGRVMTVDEKGNKY